MPMRDAEAAQDEIAACEGQGRYDGQGFAGRFAYTRLWRREGDRWRVAAAHCSAIAAA